MFTLLLLWALWCFLHSLLLTPTCKTFLCRGKPCRIAGYRIFYNIFAACSLVPLVWFTHSFHPQQELFNFPGLWSIPRGLLLGYGIVMFYFGARTYDLEFFLGIRQIIRFRACETAPPEEFSRQGILAHIRHPWYGGGIALLWTVGPITNVNCGVKLLLTTYLIVGACLEERRLKKKLGREYLEYCKQVPRFFPRIKKK